MKTVLSILALVLVGCSTLSRVSGIPAPDLTVCQHVSYERTGQDVKLSAECKA